MTQQEVMKRLSEATDEPHRIYWRNKIVNLETVRKLIEIVNETHSRGLVFCSVHMNQIEAHLTELEQVLQRTELVG